MSTKSSCNRHSVTPEKRQASRSPHRSQVSAAEPSAKAATSRGPSEQERSRSLSPRGPASLYMRGEAWLERKRSRERSLREEAQRQEVSECTFQPKTFASASSCASLSGTSALSTSYPRPMTPERARQLFDRQQTWRLRLDEESDRRRQEQRAEEEREVQLCRRAASAGPALRRREEEALDADTAFANFHERNRRWQRERETRWEQLHDEVLRSHTRPSRSRPRSASETPRPKPGLAACERTAQDAEQPLPCHALLVPAPPEGSPNLTLARRVPHAAPGQPVRALPVPGLSACASLAAEDQSSDGERFEVFSHLQALRQHLICSKGRSSEAPGWQRALQVEGARLMGAGAAPFRAGPVPALGSQPSPRAEATPRRKNSSGSRQRGRSCGQSQPQIACPGTSPRGASRSPARASRQASPVDRLRAVRVPVVSVDVAAAGC